MKHDPILTSAEYEQTEPDDPYRLLPGHWAVMGLVVAAAFVSVIALVRVL